MNPISFSCSHCARAITVPPEGAGRAVPCPHCKQATLVPNAGVGRTAPIPVKVRAGDQGPDFTETLRKAREATDSIFHDQDDEGDSLFGGSDAPRKLFVPPPVSPQSQTPTALSDPSQPTLRVPGLSNLPPISIGNPFADLSIDSPPDAAGDLQASGAMVEDDEGEQDPEVVAHRTFPWKNAIISALMLYGVVMTGLAAWGWLRTPETSKASPASNIGKR